MAKTTRTGKYIVGFRVGAKGWQADLDAVIAWACAQGFGALDLVRRPADDITLVKAAGLQVGSVDLVGWKELISPDPGRRREAVDAAAAQIETCAGLGARLFLVVMLPEDPARERGENFGYMVESYAALAPVLEKANSRLVIEGWPGPGALCCTPETCRAFFKECPSPVLGLNYDPSHLIRMGIDPLRFLREFAPRIYHLHAKDALRLPDDLYTYGAEQPAAFKKRIGYSGATWRYALPGMGEAPWTEIFRLLQESGYNGLASIELEDCNFNGTEEGEKTGLAISQNYLTGC